MKGRYIKILTALGLVAIVAIQSLWLVNTCRLIEVQVGLTSNRLFPKVVLDEVVMRLDSLTEQADSTITLHPQGSYDSGWLAQEGNVLDFIIKYLFHYAD